MKKLVLLTAVSLMTLVSFTSCTPDELPQIEVREMADNGDIQLVPPKKGGN